MVVDSEGVLELLVENAWVVETLKALGSGHMLHLSFSYDQVEPETLAALKEGTLGRNAPGEVLVIGPVLKRVAIFEIEHVNLLPGHLRLDFRLISVAPFIRDGMRPDGINIAAVIDRADRSWCDYRQRLYSITSGLCRYR